MVVHMANRWLGSLRRRAPEMVIAVTGHLPREAVMMLSTDVTAVTEKSRALPYRATLVNRLPCVAMGQPDVDVVLIVAATAISVLGAIVSGVLGFRLTQRSRLEDAEQLAVRFREPLLQAAFNLQSRLYNIERQAFLERFLLEPTSTLEEQEYAVRNTTFLVGQYLGWVEAIRRESQYMDPRSRARNRAIVHHMERVRDTLSDSTTWKDRTFRLFRGEQRAMGEVMLVRSLDAQPGLPRWECRGYASFVADEDAQLRRWFRPLENDVTLLAKEPARTERLVAVQNALLDLVDALDPDGDRVPLSQRQRL